MKSNHNSGKVVPLRLVPPPAKQVSTTPTVEMLEKLLQKARSSQLDGIIYVATTKQGWYKSGWAGEGILDGPIWVLGALERLKSALLEYAREEGYTATTPRYGSPWRGFYCLEGC